MASLIPGYEYDIFISYRQKDNKGEKWVSEFVDALRTELDATFKEDISIYFDENPHDRLQDTHNVDKSLEGKLKCLIFIPILSQTFCDPNSYAWQREFLAFNRLAGSDYLGREIKLKGGNVASRILPIRIHDLEPDDIKLFEKETGTVLRALDFVFKTSTGVNRPLRANEDHPGDNLNKTFYRDQINKVANAIKEIISGLQKEKDGDKISPKVELSAVQKPPADLKHSKKNYKKHAISLAVTVVLCSVIWLGYKFIFKSNSAGIISDKSIAVLPFSDFSASHDQEYFSNGMMEEILNQLAKIGDLDVKARTSSMRYKDSKLSLKRIARELGVSNIVEGSVQKAGNSVRITVQLIDGVTEKHKWSEKFDRELNDIFSVQTEISMKIAKQLNAIFTKQEENLIRQIPTKNSIAHDYYLKGNQFSYDTTLNSAITMYGKAIEQDSDFALAYLARASLYSTIFFTKGESYTGDWKSFDRLAKEDLLKAIKINPDLPEVKYEQAEQLYRFDRKHDKALELLDEIENQMSNNPNYFYLKSLILRRKGKFGESINEGKKAISLDPLLANYYIQSGHTNYLMRKYSEAVQSFKKPYELGIGNDSWENVFRAELMWKGDLAEALKISGSEISYLGKITDLSFNYFYYNREYNKLITNIVDFEDQFIYFPRSLTLAYVYFLKFDIPLSRQYADSAIEILKHKLAEFPEDDRYYGALGYAYAFKGEKIKAIDFARKAVKLKPVELDAWQGFEKEKDLAQIYVLTGEYDQALDKIEYLLTIPGDLSVPLLKIDPAFDKLRDLPRFMKILSTEYKTVY
jgi:TolB-like protein